MILYAVVTLFQASITSLMRWGQLERIVSADADLSSTRTYLNSNPNTPVGIFSVVRFLAASTSLVAGVFLSEATNNNQWVSFTLTEIFILLGIGLLHIGMVKFASVHRERIATFALPLLKLAHWIIGPFTQTPSTTNGSGDEEIGDPLASELTIVADSDAEPLEEFEVRMIRGVVGLDTTTAREIMLPRVDITAVELGAPIPEVATLMVESGHSRLPAYEEDLDHIKGVIYARDVMEILNRENGTPATLTPSMVRTAQFIPETKTLEELLKEFQDSRVHMAIVVDEHGGVEGLVTIEDLLEEIVGEIHDEFDEDEPTVEQVTKDEFLVDARISVDALEDLLHVEIEGDGYDTVGGFVYERLGRIPNIGDTITHGVLKIEVLGTTGRRLDQIRVTKQSSSTHNDG